MNVDRHIDLLPEGNKDRHQPVNRKATEFGMANTRKIGN